MWTDCPTVLDDPVKVVGLDLLDVGLVAFAPLVLSCGVSTGWCFAGAGLLGAALYFVKRGKPPGALAHALHTLEFIKLPGILSPHRQTYTPW